MDSEYSRLADTIRQQASKHSKPRYLVAIAGVPGSGKTTTAQAVVQQLNKDPNIHAALLSMDGFHLPRSELDQLPNPKEAHIRRGAPGPSTWPASCNSCTIYEPEIISAPAFDHKTKDPVENGISITPDARIIIVEGNYLLLDEPGWRDLANLVDYRVFVDTDLQEARERTAKRHVLAGIEKTLEDGYRRVDSNDYLNGVSIREKLIGPDLVVKSVSVNINGAG
ncbi:uncharacterized protein N7458_011308 [Penicillium daleae]|uniref:Phosphoribulokinase/uridine kinase domain-containing protein n=1 Tax=Penicillium daleae TaxID=63821 RepID=A0AAD6FW98_9EURO|nr:uncharacterized protein N7458_011308 [Penicillium daleae]KAJ5432152.1 hypothetical protein N7458_011308 [Penicillium daleae]